MAPCRNPILWGFLDRSLMDFHDLIPSISSELKKSKKEV